MAYSRCNRRGKSRADKISGGILLTLLLSATAPQILAGKLEVAGFMENATHYRESRDLSKFRNTAQLEFGKDISGAFKTSNLTFNATFRATYDGVYDLNDDEWGNSAGGSIMLENGSALGPGGPGTGPTHVPHGGGLKFAVDGVPTGLPPTLGFRTPPISPRFLASPNHPTPWPACPALYPDPTPILAWKSSVLICQTKRVVSLSVYRCVAAIRTGAVVSLYRTIWISTKTRWPGPILMIAGTGSANFMWPAITTWPMVARSGFKVASSRLSGGAQTCSGCWTCSTRLTTAATISTTNWRISGFRCGWRRPSIAGAPSVPLTI